MPGKVGRLVEPARPMPRPMERDRHGRVRAQQDVSAPLAHERRQPARNRPARIVLERVNHRSQRAVVDPDRPGPIDLPHGALAPIAARARLIDRVRGRQRIAARVAEGRCKRENRLPARPADWAARRLLEGFGASHASRSEEHRHQGIGDRSDAPGAFRAPRVRRYPIAARDRRTCASRARRHGRRSRSSR